MRAFLLTSDSLLPGAIIPQLPGVPAVLSLRFFAAKIPAKPIKIGGILHPSAQGALGRTPPKGNPADDK
ncbi:MAG: hypothetical protein LAP85_14675 [Acidobacteriia bacterium]|nr:hypothetical protein [Terriglobia bacterium]